MIARLLLVSSIFGLASACSAGGGDADGSSSMTADISASDVDPGPELVAQGFTQVGRDFTASARSVFEPWGSRARHTVDAFRYEHPDGRVAYTKHIDQRKWQLAKGIMRTRYQSESLPPPSSNPELKPFSMMLEVQDLRLNRATGDIEVVFHYTINAVRLQTGYGWVPAPEDSTRAFACRDYPFQETDCSVGLGSGDYLRFANDGSLNAVRWHTGFDSAYFHQWTRQ
jgi:hypothetical protein